MPVILLNVVFVMAHIAWDVITCNYYNDYLFLHLYAVVFKTKRNVISKSETLNPS